MARAVVVWDESYDIHIFPAKGHRGQPHFNLPIEVPDEVLRSYLEAAETERTLRKSIVETYGVSPLNPNYDDEWAAWRQSEQDV